MRKPYNLIKSNEAILKEEISITVYVIIICIFLSVNTCTVHCTLNTNLALLNIFIVTFQTLYPIQIMITVMILLYTTL